MKTLLPLVFALLLPAAAAAQVKTIYGEDSRRDFFEADSAAERAAMMSAVSLFRDTALQADGDSFRVKGSILGSEARRLCPGERFFEQRSAAFCSGTLIAPDLVLTAGHCMGPKNKPADRCAQARFVFGYAVETRGQRTDKVAAADVYSCAEVKLYVHDADGDYAVVRLDRAAAGRKPAALRLAGPPAAGLSVFTVGGPYGLPLKIAGDAVVRGVSRTGTFFRTNLDTSGGNSGGGIFGAQDGGLIGLHTASYDPDLVEVPLPPGHGLPETDARVKEGRCKLMTALEQDGGRGKKGYSLSAVTGLPALLGGGKEAVLDMPPAESGLPSGGAGLPAFAGF